MRVVITKRFHKKSERLPLFIQDQLDARLGMFLDNPFHPILNNHKLKGKWQSCRSINITGDWRAIYEPAGNAIAIFVDIDTHHNLYGG